jgi:glycosyltransferase involved in cell wall biosynthesis
MSETLSTLSGGQFKLNLTDHNILRQILPVKSPERIALVLGDQSSAWISCQTITPNIVRAYEIAFGDKVRVFSSYNLAKHYSNYRSALSIATWQPDRIVFVDHRPHPGLLLKLLLHMMGERLPPVVVHVYGDFTLETAKWLSLKGTLQKVRIQFVCASTAQDNLVRQFIVSPKRQKALIPFPVDEDIYSFDPLVREQTRKQLGVEKNDFVFIYTGRMSIQKNCIGLLNILNWLFNRNKSIKVFFAGPFDDMGVPFFGIRPNLGNYFNHWVTFLDTIDPELKERIRYLGVLNPEQLRGLYNAADCYLSLSAHHDEDFGMAPAEALMCGTPAILSNWGGYRNFGIFETAVDLVPILAGKPNFRIDLVAALAVFERRIKNVFTSSDRKALSDNARSRLSVYSVAEQLPILHANSIAKFRGFYPLIHQHVKIMQTRVLFPKGAKRGGLYQRIYRNYYD